MEYKYKTSGTCSQEIIIEIEKDIIKKENIVCGCAGNTKGISTLVEGMRIDDVIQKLKGIPCRDRGTSCPDQLARALEQIKEYNKRR